jgi:hypothetical protein
MEKNYFTRKINVVTGNTSEISFYETEENAQKAFNKLCDSKTPKKWDNLFVGFGKTKKEL